MAIKSPFTTIPPDHLTAIPFSDLAACQTNKIIYILYEEDHDIHNRPLDTDD